MSRQTNCRRGAPLLNTHFGFAGVWFLLLLGWVRVGCAYSLLTHEEIVDISWKDQIQPLLLKRYPAASPEQMRRAHGFAYGGCLIQDIGYYPFGDAYFSELTHYVRTGDFVANLIGQSSDLEEYAFALGAVAHYCSDYSGHPAVNHSVALSFPKLRAKFGEQVTYEECPKAHIQTEFGFDITQVAKNRYTSDRYHDFIGFNVSRPLLERAFFQTYGLRLEAVLGHVELAIGTFRHAVSTIIPQMTRAALTAYHPEIVRDTPNFNERQFLYNLSRAQYETEWGKEYRKPGIVARAVGLLVRLVPKFGLLRALAFKIPSSQTEDLYIESVNRTVQAYREALEQVNRGELRFPNLDCDTGRPTVPGEYSLGDRTHARLLEDLVKNGLEGTPPDLRTQLLAFYAQARPPTNRKQLKAWRRTTRELQALKAGPGSPIAAEVRTRLLLAHRKLESPKAREQSMPLMRSAQFSVLDNFE